MALSFKQGDFRKMLEIQRGLAEVLNRANRDKTEAALAAFACIRLARELLDKYPAETKAMLLEGIVIPFLVGTEPDITIQ